MAEEVITLEMKIEAADAANTIKDLNKSLKVLRDEIAKVPQGSTEFKKLAHAINEAEGKIGDITDSFSTLTGSGVERTEKSLGLLREGFSKLDTGKISLGFKALSGAMSAIPLLLVVEGFNYIRENFEKLSKGSGVLASVLRGVGEVIDWLKEGLTVLNNAIEITIGFFQNGFKGISETAERIRKEKLIETLGKDLTEAIKTSKEALEEQTNTFDRQIKIAKAAGKSTIQLEKEKQEAIVATNVALVKQIEAYVRAGGVLDEERKKQLTASLNAIKDAKTEERVIEETHNKEMYDKYKELNEKKKWEDKLRFKAKEEDYQNDIQVTESTALTEQEIEANKNAELLALSTWRGSVEDEQRKKEDEDKRLSAEKEKEHRREVANTSVELTSQSIKAAQGISDLYFAQQLKSAKGNAEKEKEIRKKQFNVNKAFGITNAVIDGVRGVQAALAMGPPIGYVFAALTAVMAGINVAQIASAKFDEGGGSSGGNVGASIGSIGSVGAEPPQIKSPNNTVTKIDDSGKIQTAQPTVKAVVVETDVTEKQKRVDNMKEVATF